LDGIRADVGGVGFFGLAVCFFEELGDGGDGGMGEKVGRGGVGLKKMYDLEVELAVRAACFFEEWLALGCGLVEDELEEAFDLGVALRCHTVGMMVAGIGESGCGGSFAPGGWFSE
jgi:hypothetical protein